MTRTFLIAAASAMLFAGGTPAYAAAPCKDAHGKFMKCPPAMAAKPTMTAVAAKPGMTAVKTTRVSTRTTVSSKTNHCRLNGKFAKCGTPGAKPA